MALSAQLAKVFEAPLPVYRPPAHKLYLTLAASYSEMRAAQRLRYQVFVEEMGAVLDCDEIGIEADRFDAHCQHLLVCDGERDRVVGCYRILTDLQARQTGGFYAQTEFDLTSVLAMPGRFMEVGRTCVHPDYRNGATIGLLWAGLARYMVMNKFDHLIGCASIPLRLGSEQVAAMCQHLVQHHSSTPGWRVFPKIPMPLAHAPLRNSHSAPAFELPPLLDAYMRMGAMVCGEPCWDPGFNVADMFILLHANQINTRYVRHFINRA